MKTVILARNGEQARHICIENGVQPYARDTIVVGSAAGAMGISLTANDRVIISGRFWARRDANEILDMVRVSMARADFRPAWVEVY